MHYVDDSPCETVGYLGMASRVHRVCHVHYSRSRAALGVQRPRTALSRSEPECPKFSPGTDHHRRNGSAGGQRPGQCTVVTVASIAGHSRPVPNCWEKPKFLIFRNLRAVACILLSSITTSKQPPDGRIHHDATNHRTGRGGTAVRRDEPDRVRAGGRRRRSRTFRAHGRYLVSGPASARRLRARSCGLELGGLPKVLFTDTRKSTSDLGNGS